jgi:hypothetical protein
MFCAATVTRAEQVKVVKDAPQREGRYGLESMYGVRSTGIAVSGGSPLYSVPASFMFNGHVMSDGYEWTGGGERNGVRQNFCLVFWFLLLVLLFF